MKYIRNLIYYSIKSIKFKNYIIFFFICIIYPHALNLSSTIFFEELIPVTAVFIYSGLMLIEFENNIHYQFCISAEHKGHIYLIRILMNFIFYIIISAFFMAYILFIESDAFAIDVGEVLSVHPLLLIFFIGGINYLFFGVFSCFLSILTRSRIIGIFFPVLFALVGMARASWYPQFILNPFSYSAGSNNFIPKIIYLGLIIVMMRWSIYKINNKTYRINEQKKKYKSN